MSELVSSRRGVGAEETLITLDSRIVKLPHGYKIWQWVISVHGWPLHVGSCEALQCWFAMCALEDYVRYR